MKKTQEKLKEILDYPTHLTDFKSFKKNYKVKLTLKERLLRFLGINNVNYYTCWGITAWGVGYLFKVDFVKKEIKYLNKKRDFLL